MVNIAKTKVSAFGKNPRSLSLSHLRVMTWKWRAYKYLGVWITTNSNYNKPQQAQANQGKKAIFALQRLFAKLKYPPIPNALKLLDVMILTYGRELLGQAVNPELEAIGIHFLKYVLNLLQSATNMSVRGIRFAQNLQFWGVRQV